MNTEIVIPVQEQKQMHKRRVRPAHIRRPVEANDWQGSPHSSPARDCFLTTKLRHSLWNATQTRANDFRQTKTHTKRKAQRLLPEVPLLASMVDYKIITRRSAEHIQSSWQKLTRWPQLAWENQSPHRSIQRQTAKPMLELRLLADGG